MTAVAAIEFKEDDNAAAKIAATTNPLNPVGIYLVIKSGKTLSPPVNGNVAASFEPSVPIWAYSGKLNG
ncbi:MAG: hypothetical protein HC846_12725 [Blastocatellia bacterium]|nr:hypothetical protein [Blastocatellia bacterium]